MMIKLKQIGRWLDENILFCLATFLLLFVPLWPKIPLADVLPGYIVRMRLEDVLVAITLVIYLIWLARGKINAKMPTWQLIVAYVAVGAMSIVSGVWLVGSIPFAPWAVPSEVVHLQKSVLHLARYIEYFFLAWLFFSTIKTRLQQRIVAATMVGAVLAVSLYGVGQKYLYWPLFSTMNREFSKGEVLYLSPHARVQSTFGGHYDFAAYLVLLLPFTLLIAWHAPKKWQRIVAWAAQILGLWSLTVSAARSSVVAYFVAAGLLFVLNIGLFSEYQTWGRKIKALLIQGLLYGVLVMIMVLSFGGDMVDRFTQILDKVPVIHNTYHTANKYRKEVLTLLNIGEVQPPENATAVELEKIGDEQVMTPSDSRPVSEKPMEEVKPEVNEAVEELVIEKEAPPPESSATERPVDVYVDVPDVKVGVDASGAAYTYETPRVWSENALNYTLSLGIRLDTLWPNAIRGFTRNPLVGSGYGTLTKGENTVLFTEADSTDNNFLRTLGETGLLGFLTFYGAIGYSMYYAGRHLREGKPWRKLFNLGFLVASVGILLNAVYIDVFAASKVAFTFWSLYGIFWAINSQNATRMAQTVTRASHNDKK